MTAQTLFNSAELALAAYASLVQGDTRLQTSALQAQGKIMSAKESEEFALRYPTVVTAFNDTATSFNATVFKDTAGNMMLAIRGTQEAGDFVPTDANIALNGAGYDQIVAMFNWWQRATSLEGELVAQRL